MNNVNGLVAALIVCSVIAGCGQRQVPPPYPRETVEPQSASQESTQTETIKESELTETDSTSPPEPGSPAIDTTDLGPKATPFSAGFVNDRISFYNERFEALKKLDASSDITTMDPRQTKQLFNCSQDLQRLLDGYQGFHDALFQGGGITEDQVNYQNMIALQRLDIAFMNSTCADLLGSGGADDTTPGLVAGAQGIMQVEKEIDGLFQSEAYDEVVNAWEQLPSYQHDRVDVKTAIRYADALMYLDKPAQSADAYRQVLERNISPESRNADPLVMRKRLADLYTAAGNFFEAEKQYELLLGEYEQVGTIEIWARLQLSLLEQSMKGSPELTDYMALLRSYLGYIPARDGFSIVWKAEEFLQQHPYSPVSDNVDMIKTDAVRRADLWFTSFMAQADALVAEKQFQEAIALLQSVPADKLSPDNLVLLKEKLDGLILAEAVDRETVKLEKMQELQRIWNEGTALAEAGEFDNAIEVYRELEGTEYDARVQEKIGELALTASKIERRKAADLFVRSTKTDDMAAKKQLLTESRRVLKDILEKYPDVDIADKVRGNIRQVEKKMNQLDPMMLPEIEQRERDQQMLEPSVDEEIKIEGFDVDSPVEPSLNQTKKVILPINTPQSLQ